MMLKCRLGCAACCIEPSISSPILGMSKGKAAGVRCVQLDAQNLCLLFNDSRRPAVCAGLKPSLEMCGDSREQAMMFLSRLERETQPKRRCCD